MPRALIVVAALLLVSCTDQKAFVQKFVPKDDDAFARRFVDLVKNRQYEDAKVILAENLRDQADSELPNMQRVVDHGNPQSFEAIGCFINYSARSGEKPTKQVELTYQIHFPDAWALAEIVIQSSDEGRTIAGAHFNVLPDSLEVLNRFTFKNKTPVHYLFFFATVGAPIFIIVTLIVCIRSRVRRRWLWIIVILLGIVQFQLNWSTGAWDVQPLSIVLLGSAFWSSGLYGPWILKFAIPLGAIIFILCRRRLHRRDEPPPLSPGSTTPPESGRSDY